LKEMGIIVGIAVLLDAARAADARADPAAPHGLGRLVAAEVARPALPDVRFGH
jgi:hypothetical protein